jgi:hypothetical protein
MAEAPLFKANTSQSNASLTVAAGGRGCRGGGPLCVATEKNAKIAKVHSITSRFGHEALVKIKLFTKVHEKNKDKAFYCN